MRTEDLVARLAGEARATGPSPARRWLAAAAAAGATASLALLVAWLGVRPLGPAVAGGAFWMKAAYCAALGAAGWIATRRMARPDGRLGLAAYAAPAAFGIAVVVAAAQLATAGAGQHLPLVLGQSWTRCPWRILALSAPVLLALLVSLRHLAPTRLQTAGAAAGLLAGGLGAAVYGLYCPETSAAFVAAWYSLGIGLTIALGAVLAPRLLRW